MTKPLSIIFAVLLICLLSIFTGCRPPSLDLDHEEITIVDTLYRRAITDFRKELDSICDAQHDSLVQVKVDSLVERQLGDLIKLTTRE